MNSEEELDVNLSLQDIQRLTAQELQHCFLKARSKIYIKKRKKENTKELEILFCYLTREIEERN